VLGIVGISMAAALFGATFTWYLFGGRVRKIRIRSFMKRR
jgi:ubiquinone biosynthesis protein